MAITLENRYARLNPIVAEAHRLIDQSWIDEGFTAEDLARDDVMADVYEGLLTHGETDDEAQNYLAQTPWEEIERKHRELFPRLYESNGTS